VKRARAAALVTAYALLVTPAAAHAANESPLTDQGSNPDYRSVITSVAPRPQGLALQILQFADRLQLTNHTGKTIVVYGYSGEPYVRILPDGTVEENVRSPAVYLNASFYGNATVPASANAGAAPQWKVVDRTGTFEWHDHRIHWMSPVPPPQVTHANGTIKIFDWQVPLAIAGQRGAIDGALYWKPQSSSTPIAAIVSLIVLVGLALTIVGVVRRRRARGRGPGGPAGAGPPQPPTKEAW
jgi:hypothetical protein